MRDPDPLFEQRAAGVLLHITSLPGPFGVGDLGPAARRFVDWLAEGRQSLWQALPIGPVGNGDSPYSARSSFAGEPLLISLEDLATQGLLQADKLACDLDGSRARFRIARSFRHGKLHQAWNAWRGQGGEGDPAYQSFVEGNQRWLDPWCALHPDADEQRFVQYQFESQWRALRSYANERGVRMLGDVPVFVPADGADVAAARHLFRLDEHGQPDPLTGAPPDGFNADGQCWGHPHYDWARHEEEGFAWWVARVARLLEIFDSVRLDHFSGYLRAWEVPASSGDPLAGRSVDGPGAKLLEAFVRDLGPSLPLFTEDMCADPTGVDDLRREFALPCMRIIQQGFGGDDSPHLPHNVAKDTVYYTGNHDCDTTRGWWRGLDEDSRRRTLALVGGKGRDVHRSLARAVFASPAVWAILPAQDVLGLAGKARMNRPGVPKDQWRWRLGEAQLTQEHALDLRELTEASARSI
ncbi:MAG: 4-alpha-glucanotransferase [Planctomycetota bacterium]|nr:4-alpha-glucanotransferase [Planctomycetota bacterium]